ncbi:MAG: hypothetical protein ACXWC2_04895 [Ramlibacter sp.]
MQQQQRPRDRIATMQQMAGSSEFQPPQQGGDGGKPQQLDARGARADGRRTAGLPVGDVAGRPGMATSRADEQARGLAVGEHQPSSRDQH